MVNFISNAEVNMLDPCCLPMYKSDMRQIFELMYMLFFWLDYINMVCPWYQHWYISQAEHNDRALETCT